ncbi:MAG: hypothetical protein ACKN9T_02220 [Candidatus Methylumidiphilus sp.]
MNIARTKSPRPLREKRSSDESVGFAEPFRVDDDVLWRTIQQGFQPQRDIQRQSLGDCAIR